MDNNVFIITAMMNMYNKCGSLNEAVQVFNKMDNKDTVTWNALISAYRRHERGREALDLFERMKSDGIQPDANTYNIVLTICADMGALEVGKKIHKMIPSSLSKDVFVRNGLINMYNKCAELEEAIQIFNAMNKKERTVVTWTAIISAYSTHEKGKEALELFDQMKMDGIEPTANTYNIVLAICANMGSLDIGQKIHKMIPSSLLGDAFVKSALINMYSKCGRLEEARLIFNAMNNRDKDTVIWGAMISGYGMHGQGREALELFDQMTLCEVKPDSTTFVSLLIACSHSGLVDDALEFFNSMDHKYGVQPSAIHRTCMVDALSRAGQLEKAEACMNEIEEPDIVSLTTLLGACRSYGDVERAERVFSQIIALNPSEASAYVLLANIYALAGRTEDSNKIRLVMKEKKIKKIPGMTNITVDGQVYSFVRSPSVM